eukprot:7984240-Pyramimonas_sp.AAC.1
MGAPAAACLRLRKGPEVAGERDDAGQFLNRANFGTADELHCFTRLSTSCKDGPGFRLTNRRATARGAG